MSINEAVLNIYRPKWQALCEQLKKLEPDTYANPLALAFDEAEYANADIKVMIFGQVSKGWLKEAGLLDTAEAAASGYYNFFCRKTLDKAYAKSTFWQAFLFFKAQIEAANPNKRIYLSWNNVNKIGKFAESGVDKQVQKIENQFFSVVTAEVAVFKPDIVIFLTGPNRDTRIIHHFEDAHFQAVDANTSIRALAKVTSKYLPENTVRLYHPSYLGGYYRVRHMASSLITAISRSLDNNNNDHNDDTEPR